MIARAGDVMVPPQTPEAIRAQSQLMKTANIKLDKAHTLTGRCPYR
jgi:hypothetical protein